MLFIHSTTNSYFIDTVCVGCTKATKQLDTVAININALKTNVDNLTVKVKFVNEVACNRVDIVY